MRSKDLKVGVFVGVESGDDGEFGLEVVNEVGSRDSNSDSKYVKGGVNVRIDGSVV